MIWNGWVIIWYGESKQSAIQPESKRPNAHQTASTAPGEVVGGGDQFCQHFFAVELPAAHPHKELQLQHAGRLEEL